MVEAEGLLRDSPESLALRGRRAASASPRAFPCARGQTHFVGSRPSAAQEKSHGHMALALVCLVEAEGLEPTTR